MSTRRGRTLQIFRPSMRPWDCSSVRAVAVWHARRAAIWRCAQVDGLWDAAGPNGFVTHRCSALRRTARALRKALPMHAVSKTVASSCTLAGRFADGPQVMLGLNFGPPFPTGTPASLSKPKRCHILLPDLHTEFSSDGEKRALSPGLGALNGWCSGFKAPHPGCQAHWAFAGWATACRARNNCFRDCDRALGNYSR